MGLSIQDPGGRRAHKDTRMHSCGFGEGLLDNASVQSFFATPLLNTKYISVHSLVKGHLHSECFEYVFKSFHTLYVQT